MSCWCDDSTSRVCNQECALLRDGSRARARVLSLENAIRAHQAAIDGIGPLGPLCRAYRDENADLMGAKHAADRALWAVVGEAPLSAAPSDPSDTPRRGPSET